MPALIVEGLNGLGGGSWYDYGHGNGGSAFAGQGGAGESFPSWGDGPGDGDGGYYLFGDGSANVQWSESVLCVL